MDHPSFFKTSYKAALSHSKRYLKAISLLDFTGIKMLREGRGAHNVICPPLGLAYRIFILRNQNDNLLLYSVYGRGGGEVFPYLI
jgi:hypothetical protein